ncbi:thioredoxin family Trp26 protein [Cryptosporidium felis]|nr:thioredoxin family Trp26 protein [Cryptosporidium felis]
MPGEHGGLGCNCQHEGEIGGGKDLLPSIELDGVTALNEFRIGSCKGLFRPYEERLREDKVCKSQEDDPELMIFVRFSSPCTLSSLSVIGGDEGKSPNKVNLFVNDDSLDFSSISDGNPAQSLDLTEDFCGTLEYPLRVSRFQNVSLLVLHFPSTFGGDQTWIYYIRLMGESSGHRRKAVETIYESKPNISDHKSRIESSNHFTLM